LTQSELVEILLKITLIFGFGILVASLFKRHPSIRNWIWVICFTSPILFLLPLPTFKLPVLPQKEWVPSFDSRVYELDPQFALRQTVYRGDPPWSWLLIGVGLLATLGLAVLAYRLVSTLRIVRQAEQAVDEERLSLLYELGLAHGLSDVPMLKRSDSVESPCVWGISQPVILVPANLECDERDWRLILEHELVHLAHRDPARLVFYSIVRHAVWWHPLVWLAFKASELSQEEAVDQRLGPKPGYAKLLASVHIATPRAGLARPFGQSHLLTRVRSLAKGPAESPNRWAALGLATFVPFLIPIELVSQYNPRPDQIGTDEVVFISVRDGESRLWRSSVDGRDPSPLDQTFVKAGVPSLSPDGKWFAYNRSFDGQEDIYISRVDGSEEQRIVASPKRDVQPRWSREGDKLLFCTMASGNWELGLADIASKRWRYLTKDGKRNLEPSWHPNGQRIVFSSHRSGSQKLWSMNLDGSGLVQLTHVGFEDTHGRYSSNGRYLLYSSNRRAKYEMTIMDLATREVQPLVKLTQLDTGEGEFADGESAVVMTSNDGSQPNIARVELDDFGFEVISGGYPSLWPFCR